MQCSWFWFGLEGSLGPADSRPPLLVFNILSNTACITDREPDRLLPAGRTLGPGPGPGRLWGGHRSEGGTGALHPPLPGRSGCPLIGPTRTLLASHWLRNVEARLSLVESFRVLLAPAVLCHKEPARASKAPAHKKLGLFCLPLAGLYAIRIVGFHARKEGILRSKAWFFMA